MNHVPPAARSIQGRLHLQHGPIDLIIDASGPGRAAAFQRAIDRFQTVLTDLVAVLPDLRRPVEVSTGAALPRLASGGIPARMLDAVLPFKTQFVTPMAAVAGAVADDVLGVIAAAPGITKAWVNNGGDIAFHLSQGTAFSAQLADTDGIRVEVPFSARCRGVATSGWHGRSHSLGIADAVTVLAQTAAAADVAATLIANAVDLPGHPAVQRRPAETLSPDSDLGMRPVTIDVGPLSSAETVQALDRGVAFARDCAARGLIEAAHLTLNNHHRRTGELTLAEPHYA
ncbi:MAG: UPF0280 family protein [Pseudomonadota bacterium]